jgi:hypothetical protein
VSPSPWCKDGGRGCEIVAIIDLGGELLAQRARRPRRAETKLQIVTFLHAFLCLLLHFGARIEVAI